MGSFLIIDHDLEFSLELKDAIELRDHTVTHADRLRTAIREVQAKSYEVVLFNIQMPDGQGIESLPDFLHADHPPEVVVLADRGDPDEAEHAIRIGAWDYIERPSNPRALALSLVHILDYRKRKTIRKSGPHHAWKAFKDIAGSGLRMKACQEVSMLAAQSDANVLISGETGTGKELFALAIHNNSRRAKGHFVVVDCASLPETLVESTLFGHERGAFTGAHRSQKGLILRADGGTLFLDEVGELPLPAQKAFLRVLQERRFRTVGGTEEIRSDFRLIAATNRDLDAMVEKKRFRKDLLFRLRAFSIHLPPLRDRIEDIHEIVMHHMPRISKHYGCRKKTFSPDFFEALSTYRWPGNVRELVNALERAISVAQQEPTLYPKHLPTYLRVQMARSSIADSAQSTEMDGESQGTPRFMAKWGEAREAALAAAEKQYLKELLTFTQGRLAEAIRVSGLSRSRLYALLKKHRMRIWEERE